MQIYNYAKLIGRMRECGETQRSIAKKIGICECSINLSLNNKRNFRQDEISKICNVLNVDSSQIEEYFFTQKL